MKPQMAEKQTFQQKLEAQLKEWDAKLEELKGGTEKAWEEMRKALDRIASRFK